MNPFTNFLRLAQFSGREPRQQFWPFVGIAFVAYFILAQLVMLPFLGQMMGDMMRMSSDPAFLSATQSQDPVQMQAQMQAQMPAMMKGMIPGLLRMFAASFAAHLAFVAVIAAAVARRLRDGGVSPWWGVLPLAPSLIAAVLVPLSVSDTFTGPGSTAWLPSPQAIALFFGFMANSLANIAALVTLIVMLCRPSRPDPASAPAQP